MEKGIHCYPCSYALYKLQAAAHQKAKNQQPLVFCFALQNVWWVAGFACSPIDWQFVCIPVAKRHVVGNDKLCVIAQAGVGRVS